MAEPNEEIAVNEVDPEVQQPLPTPHIPARPSRQSTPADQELSHTSDPTTATTTEPTTTPATTEHPSIPQRPISRPTRSQESKETKQELNAGQADAASSGIEDLDIPVIPSRPLRQQLEEPVVPQRPSRPQEPVIPQPPQTSSTATPEPIVPNRPQKKQEAEPIIPQRPQRTTSQEPVIPGRPESTKSKEDVTETEAQPPIPSRPASKTAEPVIPSRPERKAAKAAEPAVSSRPVTAPEDAKVELDNLIGQLEKDLDGTVEPSVHAPVENEDESPIEPVTSSSGLRLPADEDAGEQTHPEDQSREAASEGQLNSENPNSLSTFGDGEVTPGNSNTKASFKSDEDEDDQRGNHLGHGDSSSFDDDVETISQEKEDDLEEAQGRRASEQPLVEPIVEAHEPTVGEEEDAGGDETDTEKVDAKEGEGESVEVKETVVTPPKEETKQSTPSIPSRPPKKASLSRSTTEEESIGLDHGKSNINKPIIPKRPTAESLTSADESTSSTSSGKPTIPVRPTKSSTSSSETVAKLKPPPPKPKKLSSKIAAFQQQLFNPTKSSSSADENEGEAEPTPRKPVDSSKFLLRFGGKGIPLPGMFNPGQIPVRPKSSAKDEDEEEEGSSRSAENAPVRRTRGPRGKKLPKAVSEAKVETESKFCLESGELFGLVFTKKVEDAQLEEELVEPEKAAEEDDLVVGGKEEEEEEVKPLRHVPSTISEPEDKTPIEEVEPEAPIHDAEVEPEEETPIKYVDPKEDTIAEPIAIPGEFEEEEPAHRVAVAPEPKEPLPDVVDRETEDKLNSSEESIVDVKQEMEDALTKDDEIV
ncbi:Altered inheritance of mitochondria protein 21 [Candida viswanathii]|uniref:Altered inheritance of mitochondria protein 21 n=1 Tax=Candida viswanathii TaxID=5486 RepID=A0A367YAW0_9ASCO|nr:Altered inheritance of mitochondria protein 21 [Candida viswanathii]